MKDVRGLLGGYAAGTLTPEERKELFEAALHDSELFEALHDEEALRELLSDPAARAQLLQATESARFTIAGGLREWFDRPRGKVLATLLAVSLVMVSVKVWQDRTEPVEQQQRETAFVRLPAEAPQAEPPAAKTQDSPESAARPLPRVARRSTPPPAGAPSAATVPEPVLTAPAPQAAAPAAAVMVAEKAADAGVAGVVEAGQQEIRWSVLRRTQGGRFEPAPPGAVFESTDAVRLQVEPARTGALTVSDATGASLFSGRVTAGSPVVVPVTLAFTDVPEHRLRVAFVPAEPGAVRMDRMEFRRATELPSTQIAGVSVEIILRRK
jgi:hypothetical protein